MVNRKLLVIMVLQIFFVLIFVGCSNETSNQNTNSDNVDLSKFEGTWTLGDDDMIEYKFLSNGSYWNSATGYDGTWEVKNGKFYIEYNSGLNFEMTYNFSDNDNTLTLVSTSASGYTMIFHKKSD